MSVRKLLIIFRLSESFGIIVDLCMYACMYVCMYVYIYIYIYIYID